MSNIKITYEDPKPKRITLDEFIEQANNGGPRSYRHVDSEYVRTLMIMGWNGRYGDFYITNFPNAVGSIFLINYDDSWPLVVPCTESGEPIKADDKWRPLNEFDVDDLVEIQNIGIWVITSEAGEYENYICVRNPLEGSLRVDYLSVPEFNLARRVALDIKVMIL